MNTIMEKKMKLEYVKRCEIVSRGSRILHLSSHAIMAHRLEFFDGAYVTKVYVYVSLG